MKEFNINRKFNSESKINSFSQLWSDSSTPIVQPKSGPESATDAGEIDSKGINQLWGGDSNGNSFTADELEDLEFDFPDSSFDDLEWFNEVDPDGNELRLSQMLADEVWEEETEIEPPTETFEDFSKKAIEQIEAYEEEMKAKLNLDSVKDQLKKKNIVLKNVYPERF